MNLLIALGKYIYSYCTDFVINIANLFNLSYYEVNFVLFCILYPLLLILSPIVYTLLKIRLKKALRK